MGHPIEICDSPGLLSGIHDYMGHPIDVAVLYYNQVSMIPYIHVYVTVLDYDQVSMIIWDIP